MDKRVIPCNLWLCPREDEEIGQNFGPCLDPRWRKKPELEEEDLLATDWQRLWRRKRGREMPPEWRRAASAGVERCDRQIPDRRWTRSAMDAIGEDAIGRSLTGDAGGAGVRAEQRFLCVSEWTGAAAEGLQRRSGGAAAHCQNPFPFFCLAGRHENLRWTGAVTCSQTKPQTVLSLRSDLWKNSILTGHSGMGRPEPCVLFAQTFTHPQLDEYVDEVLFAEPIIITSCEFLELNSPLSTPPFSLMG
ncbi:hypothetical protein KSP39_PZI014422 [Platanthera zijinensis]|uniref:Uncharacterized protein n=1 Tax=Platanthera zijinensis TaxID=2320716 RepID=A0AAP0BBF0_9ASPA